MTAFVKVYPYSYNKDGITGRRISLREGMLLEETYQKVDLSALDTLPSDVIPVPKLPSEVREVYEAAFKLGIFSKISCRGFDTKHPNGMNPGDPLFHRNYSNGEMEGVLLGIKYATRDSLDDEGASVYLLAWWGQTQKAAEQTPENIWQRNKFTHNVLAGNATRNAQKKLIYAGLCWLVLFLGLAIFRQDLLPLLMTFTVITLPCSAFIPSIRNVWKNAFEVGEPQVRRDFFFKDYPSPEEIRLLRTK